MSERVQRFLDHCYNVAAAMTWTLTVFGLGFLAGCAFWFFNANGATYTP